MILMDPTNEPAYLKALQGTVTHATRSKLLQIETSTLQYLLLSLGLLSTNSWGTYQAP